MMKSPKKPLLIIAVFQGLSTLVGFIELLVKPEWFTPMLNGTFFAEHTVIAALLLGICVGGFQWAALVAHLARPQWLPLAHSMAPLVMVGWLAGECLVLNSFTWPHALWGGMGVLQLALVLLLLDVHRPYAMGNQHHSSC